MYILWHEAEDAGCREDTSHNFLREMRSKLQSKFGRKLSAVPTGGKSNTQTAAYGAG